MDTADDTLVYNIVKVMHEQFDDYKDAAPGAGGWEMSRQKFEAAFIPFHPAAIRYFEEIGVWTEEAQAKQEENLYRQTVLKKAWDDFFPSAPNDLRAFPIAWFEARRKALRAEGLITID